MARKPNLKSFVTQALRRASYKWPARTEALRQARLRRGIYQCADCEGEFKRKEVHLDHIQPVVSFDGFGTWDDFILRLFCDVDGFQVLCEPCHSAKTLVENTIRADRKKKIDKKSKK